MNKCVPRHVCIIMDGNRRWAREKGLDISEGYKKGVEKLKKIAIYCKMKGIQYLTVYAFSTDNWKRSNNEIDIIMKILISSLCRISEIKKNNIRIKIIGAKEKLPHSLLNAIENVEKDTAMCDGLTLSIAFNYGGKEEIVNAFNEIFKVYNTSDITQKDIEKYLYSGNLPDAELLIRTGGEQRNSGFLLWKASYSELFYLNKYWPEFSEEDMESVLLEFNERERKMGK